FDDAELVPVTAVHTRLTSGATIGEAESIHEGIYRFNPHFGWLGANYHRPLLLNRTAFNTDRWNFAAGSELIYRLGAAGLTQRSATAQVNLNYYTVGTLIVEASRDGAAWEKIGEFNGTKRSGMAEVPASFFPAENVFVRLRADGPKVNFQVNRIDYEAPLVTPIADVDGTTH